MQCIPGCKVALENVVGKDEMSHVPTIIAEPAQKALADLERIYEECSDVIKNDGEGDLSMSPSSKELVSMIAEAKKITALASQMISTIGKA